MERKSPSGTAPWDQERLGSAGREVSLQTNASMEARHRLASAAQELGPAWLPIVSLVIARSVTLPAHPAGRYALRVTMLVVNLVN